MHLLAHLIWVHLQTEMTDFPPTLLYTRSLLVVGGAPRISPRVEMIVRFFSCGTVKFKKVSESLIWRVSRVLINALYRLKELKQRFAYATPSCNVLREFL